MFFKKFLVVSTALSFLITGTSFAAEQCAAGKTLEDGILTIATGNPAYFPWVIDNKPEDEKGFESAVAYAVAKEMGFKSSAVKWVGASWDQSIQPGAKDFDFNLQQFSITPERETVVDFSDPYYSAAMAVLVMQSTIDAGAKPTIESLRKLIWGVAAGTTALPMLINLINPITKPLLYDDGSDVVAAMKANQIDATLFDFPSALYMSAAVLENGVVLGQFTAERTESPDQFGLLMEEGNPLKVCVNEALNILHKNGKLKNLEAKWLSSATGVPVIK